MSRLHQREERVRDIARVPQVGERREDTAGAREAHSDLDLGRAERERARESAPSGRARRARAKILLVRTNRAREEFQIGDRRQRFYFYILIYNFVCVIKTGTFLIHFVVIPSFLFLY